MPETHTPTWDQVKRLFSGADISFMKMLGYPLDSYSFVSQNAKVLLKRLESRGDTQMPPEPFAPWSPDKIKTLKDWIAAGFPEKEPADAELSKFIKLSEFLTGFDDLDEDLDLARWYRSHLLQGGVHEAALKKLIKEFDPSDTTLFEKPVNGPPATEHDPECEAAARALILLWYTAGGGTPDDNRFTQGLMWRVFHAHPSAYVTEPWFDDQAGKYSRDPNSKPYWSRKPEKDGRFTGLGPKSDKG